MGDCGEGMHIVGNRTRGLSEDLLQRAQHERQRGPELVADVGEERGLRPIDLGQALGPGALLLVGEGVGDGGAEVRGDLLAEGLVPLVEAPARADPDDRNTARPAALAGGDGQDAGLRDRLRPGAARQAWHRAVELVEQERSPARHDTTQGPWILGCVSAQEQVVTGFRHADLPGERHAAAVRIEGVEQAERHIVRVLAQHLGGDGVGLARRLRLYGLSGEVARQAGAPVGEHAQGGLCHCGEDAFDSPALAADRAVRVVEVALLDVAEAVEREELIIGPRRLAGLEHRVEHRPDDVPDLGPDLGAGAPE